MFGVLKMTNSSFKCRFFISYRPRVMKCAIAIRTDVPEVAAAAAATAATAAGTVTVPCV